MYIEITAKQIKKYLKDKYPNKEKEKERKANNNGIGKALNVKKEMEYQEYRIRKGRNKRDGVKA